MDATPLGRMQPNKCSSLFEPSSSCASPPLPPCTVLFTSLLRTSLRATTGDGSGAEGRVGAAEGEREVVTWVRFDVSGRAGRGVVDGHRPLLILGYANGIQVSVA